MGWDRKRLYRQEAREIKTPNLFSHLQNAFQFFSLPAPHGNQSAREPVNVVHKSQVSGAQDKARKGGTGEANSHFMSILPFLSSLLYQQVKNAQDVNLFRRRLKMNYKVSK